MLVLSRRVTEILHIGAITVTVSAIGEGSVRLSIVHPNLAFEVDFPLDGKIVLDGNIEIHVVRIKGSSVRIGVQAPDDIRILRDGLPEEPNSHAA